MLLIISTGAYAESWTSFKFADFTGVSATPKFATNTLIYNLALSDSPTITFDGETYNISWVQGFYALSTTSNVVPEAPASLLLGLGGPVLGAVSLLRKRFGQKN